MSTTRRISRGGTTRRAVISVLVADRVGILRDITAALQDLHANIDGISQTVVEGFFTVILTASFPKPMSYADIQQAIERHFAPQEAHVVVRPHDPHAPTRTTGGDRYILTLTGRDRVGILHAVTQCLAERHVNIEDWFVSFDGPRVTHIGEVTVPRTLDIKNLQTELHHACARLGLLAHLQHDNIFRVTNEIGAVTPLLQDMPHA